MSLQREPLPHINRAGVRTPDMSEQLALNDIATTKIGLIVHELRASLGRALVNNSRAQALASAGFSKEKYRQSVASDKSDLLTERCHVMAPPTQFMGARIPELNRHSLKFTPKVGLRGRISYYRREVCRFGWLL
jgi:hypothetical protein